MQDFGKQGFVQDICSSVQGLEFNSTRPLLLDALVETYDDETLDKLATSLKKTHDSNCYPVGQWFDMDTRIADCSTKKDLVKTLLLVKDIPDFFTIEQMMKKKKGDSEYKELFAPLMTLSKAFPGTGEESLPTITKAASMNSKHEKFRQLAVVFTYNMRKGFFHCFRSFDLKEILRVLEDDEIVLPKIPTDARKKAIKFFGSFLSIMEKFLVEDKETGFWKLQQEFEGKVNYFDVQIEE